MCGIQGRNKNILRGRGIKDYRFFDIVPEIFYCQLTYACSANFLEFVIRHTRYAAFITSRTELFKAKLSLLNQK